MNMDDATLDQWMLEAAQLVKDRNADAAELVYRRVLGVRPEHPVAHYQMGLVAFLRGDLHGARRWFERAIALAPGNDFLRNNYHTWLRHVRLPPTWIADTAEDLVNGRTVRRFMPAESDRHIFIIEVAGTCHLRCPSCPVGNFDQADRPKGLMRVELFRNIIDKISAETAAIPKPMIWLFNWGEPVLNPALPEMIRIARGAGFEVMISSSLSLKRDWDPIVAAEPEQFKISLSGFSQAVYGQSHVKGDIELVKENMRLLRQSIDRTGSRTRVWAGFHLYRHNLADHDRMATYCAELGFGFTAVPAAYQPLESVIQMMRHEVEGRDHDIVSKLLVHPVEFARLRGQFLDPELDCELRFNMTNINHDGSVALCCAVYDTRNMLGVSFLDRSFDEICNLKYQHDFCRECYESGSPCQPTHPELRSALSERISTAIDETQNAEKGSTELPLKIREIRRG
ncbi:MAG: tetratricopeptide repeat protein [Rhodocyclaceae bacterium]|nr:tetratricopeptide repeat protein [Rhodocyclaceae bacterium]